MSADADGRYRFALDAPGTYLLIVSRAGFSEVARTIVIERADQAIELPITLTVGPVNAEVAVTAARSERELRQIPLHVETLTRESAEQMNALSTGDFIATAVNVTPVGNGPFGVRPRLRGLDSTRLLVLVDGERLNTARMATDRTGADVGLVPADTIHRVEIVNGAGTLMYGSDALAGTINIITGEPSFSPRTAFQYGFNGFYSSNENGRRASVTLGATTPRATIRLQTGAERFDNYEAGDLEVEDTRPFFASGQIDRGDTIDDNFGFGFDAFPDPFNAPYVRTDREVHQLRGAGQLRQRIGTGQARRAAIAAGPLSAPADVRRRLRRFRAAVLLQRDVAPVQRSRQGLGPLRSAGGDAVADQPVGDGLLPAPGAAAAEPAAGAVSGADPAILLSDCGDASGRALEHGTAGVDAGRGCAGGVRSATRTICSRPA